MMFLPLEVIMKTLFVFVGYVSTDCVGLQARLIQNGSFEEVSSDRRSKLYSFTRFHLSAGLDLYEHRLGGRRLKVEEPRFEQPTSGLISQVLPLT
jgi:hypothetical protein